MPSVRRLGETALLGLRTARHLRLTQLAALARRRGPGGAEAKPRVGALSWGAWDERVASALAQLGPVDTAAATAARMSAFSSGRIEMLGRSAPVDEVWPDHEALGPLWRYHLHYHDLLAEVAWEEARAGGDRPEVSGVVGPLEAWLSRWERGGRPVWDPYPTSVRLVSWMRILAWARIPSPLRGRMLALHAAHVELLSRTVERHLQGNHLLRNRWALVLGSHAWTGARGADLGARSRDLFFGELLAQVGEDGVHEERSPMYHARALRDALEVVAVLDALGAAVPSAVRVRIRSMAEALRWLRRSDGTLFLLNDSAHDHGVDLDRALTIAEGRLDLPSGASEGVRFFPAARLLVAADLRSRDRLLVDLGPPGPAHQPAHAHAGALGLELDLGGVPLLVDPGCSGYDGDPMRAYLRGTRAHNTVLVDGRDQSEMWATFRVARRARVGVERIEGEADRLHVEATCAPYHDRSARHRRTIHREGRVLTVEDRVEGAAGSRVELHWHLHPDWSAQRRGEQVELTHPTGAKAVLRVAGQDELGLHRGEHHPTCGWYARGFGEVVPSWTVRATVARNDQRSLRTSIEPAPR